VSQPNAESDISTQLAAIHGSAPPERIITIVDDDVAICVLRSQLVEGHPGAGPDALEPAMRAAVERTTGRTVATVVTDTHRDPDVTLLTFNFAPARAARRLEPDVR